MTDFPDQSPRRYFVDQDGQRVLIGLSVAETSEFEILEGLRRLDERRGPAPDGEGQTAARLRETRWLELYSRHEAAWRQWLVESASGVAPVLLAFGQDRVI